MIGFIFSIFYVLILKIYLAVTIVIIEFTKENSPTWKICREQGVRELK